MSNSSDLSETSVFVPADAIFAGCRADEATLLNLLSGLSRDDTLLICARTNTIITGFGPKLSALERQRKACELFCSPESAEKINAFARTHGGAARVVVFFRGQLLELVWWVAKYCRNLPGDGETYEDPQVRDRFLQAALIASALWGHRTYGERLSLDNGLGDARWRALGAFRKGVEDASKALPIAIALARGWLFFSEFLPGRMPHFGTTFQATTGLSIEQYMLCVGSVATRTFAQHAFADNPNGALFSGERFLAATAYDAISKRYLELEAQTPDELARGADEPLAKTGNKAIRERPILLTATGVSVVIDPFFYSQKIAAGPLFHLLKRADNNKANELFGAFGNAFEDYTIDILRRMYPSGSGILAQRLLTNIRGRDRGGLEFEIDAALNDVTELVVFEMKAAWLREDSLLDESGADFINQLQLKYGVVAQAGLGCRERPKGTAQLAKIIRALVHREWTGPNGEFAQALLIYPVLVVHDERLGAPGSGRFLDEEFGSLLGKTHSNIRVAPLTLMTIGDLENLEFSINAFGLRNLLSDYTRECPDRMQSLHQFIATSSYASKVRINRRLGKLSTQLMQRIKNELFPPS